MEVFSGDTNNFHFVEEIVSNNENLGENAGYGMQGFDERQVAQLLSNENFAKFPIDLSQICKLEPSKADSNHFIKYKLQDGKRSKVWECGICSKEFGHQYTLMRHLPTHTDERKFQCNTCGKAFRQMSTLSQHRAIHSAERPYVCEICQKTFNRVSTLISHRKTHTGLKPHRCHLCNKAFHQKGNLRNHIFTHTNERPYKCDICSKGFNQMSNLMCHKIKAHQRSDKPRYMCQICGKDFQKRIGLRNHEQYQHGVHNHDTTGSFNPLTRVKYTNGVLVDPINTIAMQHALATNQTPFALLRPLNGIPVLVRVLAAGEKQMLVPATAEDLKKHGQITITTQVDDKANPLEQTEVIENNNNNVPPEFEIIFLQSYPDPDINPFVPFLEAPRGSTVQIKIPVVATVVQCCGKDGNMRMAVHSPGPHGEAANDEYIFTTTTTEPQDMNSVDGMQQTYQNYNNHLQQAEVQYVDESGNLLHNESKPLIYEDNFQLETQHGDVTTIPLDGNIINLTGADGHQTVMNDNVINLNYVNEGTPEPMFEFLHDYRFHCQMLEKPQVINMADAENVLDANGVLCNDANDNYDMIS